MMIVFEVIMEGVKVVTYIIPTSKVGKTEIIE